MKMTRGTGLAAIVLAATTAFSGCIGNNARKAEDDSRPVIKQILLYGADPAKPVVFDEFEAEKTYLWIDSRGIVLCYNKSGEAKAWLNSMIPLKDTTCISGNYIIRTKTD